MPYDINSTSKRIKALRKQSGLTQEELASRLNITVRYVRYIESGAHGISIDLLVLFAEYFEVSLDYIVFGQKYPTNQLKKQIHQIARIVAEIEDVLKGE